MSSRRVLLVMTGGGGGGLQQSVVPYAAALRRAGHAVCAVVLRGSRFEDDLRNLGVQVVTTRWPRKPGFLTRLQARDIRRAALAFDAELAIGFASKGLAPTMRALHGHVPVLSRCGSMNARTMSRLLGADGLIVTSEDMRALALSLDMPEDRIFLLPNFLTADPRTAKPQARSESVIGSLGRMVPRKGFDVLIRACAILKDQGTPVRLILGGTGPTMKKVESLAREAGIEVDFRGWISNAEKPGFFGDIDIFAYPSRDEPFGFIYLEAMQAGVPVVTTDTVGARFIFQAGKDAEIVPQEDAAAMAKAISALLDAPKRREALAQAAHHTYRSRFHIDVASRTLDAIVQQALERDGRA